MNRYYDNTVMSYDANGNPDLRPLQTDRPHVFKMTGVYEFKWGTILGANWFIQSGIPQSTSFRFSGFPVFPYGRGDLGRTPVLSQLDMNAPRSSGCSDTPDSTAGEHRQRLRSDTWTNYLLTDHPRAVAIP